MQVILQDPNKGFHLLRCMARFAGILGVLQSLAWIGLAIIGITAHYCVFDRISSTDNTVAGITQQTFYHMYFGDCQPVPQIDFTSINNITLKLSAEQVNIWVWVYFAIHIVWFFSSVSLLRRINPSRLVLLNSILLIWVIITLAISALDLALGILFGMDYNDILIVAGKAVYYQDQPEVASILLAGMTASITMMIMALRGFVLWLLNVGLLCYFFAQTFIISKTTTSLVNDSGQDNGGFVSETVSQLDILRQPIDAYANIGNSNDNRSNVSVQLNVDPLKRATAMSVDSLMQRHYQRYPPGNETEDDNGLPKKNGYAVLADTNTFKPYPPVPDPDYSPQMISVMTTNIPNWTQSRPMVEGRSPM